MRQAAEILSLPEVRNTIYLFSVVSIAALTVCIRRIRTLEQELVRTYSHRKSSEVRTGKIAEVLAPMTDAFPVDVKKPGTSTVFIGQPIDYIHFDPDDGVTFIEIKSGGSELSPVQKKIREAIGRGEVHWETVRIKGNK